jgi:CheY-like chemotaxis protein
LKISDDDAFSSNIIKESITNDFESSAIDNFASNFKLKDDQITFINYTHKYCIAIIDIVNSTKITENLPNSEQIRKYYSTFLNTMASIIKQYNGKVIKNAGDCLIYYFPKTVDIINSSNDNNDKKSTFDFTTKTETETTTTTPTTSFTKYNKYDNNIKISKEYAFKNVIECGLAMIQANSTLNLDLNKNDLPSIGYKISSNYGLVELATSTNSNGVDLFGPTVNICSKINHLALPNQMVIHKDLYDIIEKTSFFKDYVFKIINKILNEYSKYPCSVYSINYIDDIRQQIDIDNRKIQAYINQRQNAQNQSNSSYNILLIDDDEDVLFTFESIIRNEGYNVTSYSDSNKALAHLSSLDPYYYDLIVIDIRMPGFNGFQLYKQIKVLNSDTKVLFLSALDVSEEIMIVCPGMSATDIIRKPIDRFDLKKKIKSLLKS